MNNPNNFSLRFPIFSKKNHELFKKILLKTLNNKTINVKLITNNFEDKIITLKYWFKEEQIYYTKYRLIYFDYKNSDLESLYKQLLRLAKYCIEMVPSLPTSNGYEINKKKWNTEVPELLKGGLYNLIYYKWYSNIEEIDLIDMAYRLCSIF